MKIIFLFASFFITIASSTSNDVQDDVVKDRNSLLKVSTNASGQYAISMRNEECVKCVFTDVGQLNALENLTLVVQTLYPNYFIRVEDIKNNKKLCRELMDKPFTFGENGIYSLELLAKNETYTICKLKTIVEPDYIYTPLIVGASVLLGLGISYAIFKCFYKRYKHKVSGSYTNNRIVNTDFGAVGSSSSHTLIDTQNSLTVKSKKSQRLRSIDVFRGLTLFLMIFANYGSGDYSFLDHAIWNGLHLADVVFPSFIFIMGISIPLSFKSLSNKNTPLNPIKPTSVLYKIGKRSVLLFFLGLVTSNLSDKKLTNLRIMGVLQRFAISYLVCALIEFVYFYANNYNYKSIDEASYGHEITWKSTKVLYLKSKFQELVLYKYQWLVSLVLVAIWCLVTFLVEVDGCPIGYLGPGGNHENATHFNCTGGAAGLIDRVILGANHLYQYPTSSDIYKSVIPYDPEGLLGSLNSIFLTYIGISVGHILLHYKDDQQRRVKFLIYTVFYGLLAAILCNWSIDDGWIPINKNLWSLSFILIAASIDFFCLIILYTIIDVYKAWSGTPFLYLGRNSITVFICHGVFASRFPFFQVDNTHGWLLFKDLYGITIWCIVAGLMDYNKVYINL